MPKLALAICRHRASLTCSAAVLLMLPVAGALAADRYLAWLEDGSRLTARAMPTWPMPGAAYRLENQDLLASSNSVRLVRDRQAAVRLAGPYVVLANGDIITGALQQLEADDGRLGIVPRVKVQLESPLMPVTGTGIAIRTDRVLRIVGSSAAGSAPPLPGAVVLADGRRLIARAIRWKQNGLSILTEGGIVEANFGDLVDVSFPTVDHISAVLDDNLWAGSGQGAAIVRLQTQGGAVLTASRISREVERIRRRGRSTSDAYYYVQPAWADQPLAIPEPLVAWCGYRRADEAPLSLLPSETLVDRRLIGRPQPWLANRAADGGLLASDDRESDLGLVTHSHSEIAFDLPLAARTLEMSVGLDRTTDGGGCVRCKVLAEKSGGEVLWDSGIIQSRDGLQETGPLDVSGLVRVVLVTEFAHEGRPAGADPFDIRDQVCWLAPLVKLDLSGSGRAERLQAILSGASEWDLVGDGWQDAEIADRWSVGTSSWEAILTLPRDLELHLVRQLRVSRGADIVEFLTACPREMSAHDFLLTANGKPLIWQNNADPADLYKWVSRYGTQRWRDDDDDFVLTDRLAYWWDLSEFRGQDVTLELTLRGRRAWMEIAWRGLSIRSAIAGSQDQEPLAPDVPLTSLTPVRSDSHKDRGFPRQDALPMGRFGEPIRFLGQKFIGGYGMKRDSAVAFEIEPEYRRFVALAGCCSYVVGPLQVVIDDRVVWERNVLTSLAPAEQIDIEIPAGAKTLTLQSGPQGLYFGYAAWANAGFLK